MLFPWQTTRSLPIHFNTLVNCIELHNKGAVLRVLGLHKERMVQLPRKVGKSGSKLTQAAAAAAAKWPLLCGGIWGWIGWINKFDKFDKFNSTVGRLVLEHASWHTHRRRLGFEIGDFGVEILETLSKARNNVFSYVFIFYNVTNVTELQYL